MSKPTASTRHLSARLVRLAENAPPPADAGPLWQASALALLAESIDGLVGFFEQLLLRQAAELEALKAATATEDDAP